MLLAAAALAAQNSGDMGLFVTLALGQCAAYGGAVWLVRAGGFGRRGLLVILLGAVLLRLVALNAPIFLSTDIYRYVWDGRVQAAGINPYRYIPTDEPLAGLRDEAIFPNINRNNYAPTIYPPVAQFLFLLATRLGETVLAMKSALLLIELIGIAALLAALRRIGAPAERILVYAWHPLPVWEIAGSGHVDAAVVAGVALALWAFVAHRRALVALALAAACLVKPFPITLAPALWRRRDFRLPLVFVAAVALAYLPYLGVGWRVLGFLPRYADEEGLRSGGGFWLLDLLHTALSWDMPSALYLAIAALLMVGLAVGALAAPPEDTQRRLRWARALGVGGMVLFSPHYAWYFVWLLPLLAMAFYAPALWLTAAAFLLYPWNADGHSPVWVGAIIYGGFALWALAEFCRYLILSPHYGGKHGIAGSR